MSQTGSIADMRFRCREEALLRLLGMLLQLLISSVKPKLFLQPLALLCQLVLNVIRPQRKFTDAIAYVAEQLIAAQGKRWSTLVVLAIARTVLWPQPLLFLTACWVTKAKPLVSSTLDQGSIKDAEALLKSCANGEVNTSSFGVLT